MICRKVLLVAATGMAIAIAGCTAATPSTAPVAERTLPIATSGPEASVVCDFFESVDPFILEAAGASMRGDNEALPLRKAINLTEALAARARDLIEKKDLATLAGALDSAAMSGGSFSDWDPAYEAFYVKYAEQCGQKLAG